MPSPLLYPNIRPVSTAELSELDPRGYARLKWNTRFRNKAEYANASRLFSTTTSDWKSSYISNFIDPFIGLSKHDPLVTYDYEMTRKMGDQGGHLDYTSVYTGIQEYYTRASDSHQFKTILVGVQALAQIIAIYTARNGYISEIPWSFYMRHTGAGLPNGGYKDDVWVHQEGWRAYQHMHPIVPGGRRARGKNRLIYEQSVLDVDYTQPIVTAVQQRLQHIFPTAFASWGNPVFGVWPIVSKPVIQRDTFLETDYKAMDQHFSLEVVRVVVFPLLAEMLNEWDYMRFVAAVEEMYYSPILCGDHMFVGLHNHLSGQTITQLFEMMYDLALYVGAAIEAGKGVDYPLNHFICCGDDVLYWDHDAESVQTVYQLVAAESTRNAVVLSPEKTRIQRDEARFCRCVYYPALPREYNANGTQYMRPAYPGSLAVNSVHNPEFPASSVTDELLSDFARLDNMGGHFMATNIRDWCYNQIKPEYIRQLPDDAESRFVDIQVRDWWYRVYGTTYTLGDSPSATQYIRRFSR